MCGYTSSYSLLSEYSLIPSRSTPAALLHRRIIYMIALEVAHTDWIQWLTFVCFNGSKSFYFSTKAMPNMSLYLRRWYMELILYVLLCCSCCGPGALRWSSQGREHPVCPRGQVRPGFSLQTLWIFCLFWISKPTPPLVCCLIFLLNPWFCLKNTSRLNQ